MDDESETHKRSRSLTEVQSATKPQKSSLKIAPPPSTLENERYALEKSTEIKIELDKLRKSKLTEGEQHARKPAFLINTFSAPSNLEGIEDRQDDPDDEAVVIQEGAHQTTFLSEQLFQL